MGAWLQTSRQRLQTLREDAPEAPVRSDRKADVIIGPIGIVIADSLLGEVTEKMALSISRANASRILIPMNKCENLIAGVPNLNTAALIADAVTKLRNIINCQTT